MRILTQSDCLYLHQEELELAKKVPQKSDGQFTAGEMPCATLCHLVERSN